MASNNKPSSMTKISIISQLGILLGMLAMTSLSATSEVIEWEKIPVETKQLVHVKTESSNDIQGKMICYERKESSWIAEGDLTAVVVGKNGITKPETKKEGDGRTPAGLYRIGMAFGYAENAETKLEYKKVTKEDLWVDDEKSPDYNRLVKAPTRAKSFEVMRRKDDAYKLGSVIEYNTDPIVPGKGSAIFMHLWSGPKKPTAGCVAMSEESMTSLLRWLDKDKKPMIFITTGGSHTPK
jgi:L,D-peptidoglycan transpeptidase YkuD (ErfK/YbiS/YcfS/YnhG family)